MAKDKVPLDTWLRASDCARKYEIPRTQKQMSELVDWMLSEQLHARIRVEKILLSYESVAGAIVHDLVRAVYADEEYGEGEL